MHAEINVQFEISIDEQKELFLVTLAEFITDPKSKRLSDTTKNYNKTNFIGINMPEDQPPDREIDQQRRSFLVASAAAGLFGWQTATGAARPEDESDTDEVSTATATDFLEGIATDDVLASVTSVDYEGVDSQITTFDTPIQGFPLDGDSPAEFSVMSSGVASDAAGDPSEFVSTNVGGVFEPDFSPDGFDAYNIATLTVELTVPEGAENLAFDYKFGTVENPSFLGEPFQDFFEALVIEPDGSTQPIGLLPDGSAVTVDNADTFSNSPGGSSQNPEPPLPEPPDTTYNAVTELQTASYDLSGMAGEQILLVLRVADASDGIYDSGVFVDDLRFTGDVDRPGFLDVEVALGEYRDAAVAALEAQAEAQAKLEAAFYDSYGEDYAAGASEFWGDQAGVLDTTTVDEDFIESSEGLLEDLDEEVFDGAGVSAGDQAQMIHAFKSELYEAMDGASDPEQVAFEYYLGTHDDQTAFFAVGGETIADEIVAFHEEFDGLSEELLTTLEQEDPDSSQVDRLVESLVDGAEGLEEHADGLIDDAEEIIEAMDEAEDEDEELDLEILGADAEVPDPGMDGPDPFDGDRELEPQLALGGAGIATVAVGAKLGIKGYKGLKAYKAAKGTVIAAGAKLKAWAAAAKIILKKTVKVLKEKAKEFIKEWAKEQLERIVKRNLLYSGAIDAQIIDTDVSDVTADDVQEESLLASWWDVLTSLFDAIFGTDWSEVEYGYQTGEVTIENTGTEELFPMLTVTIQGWTPESNYVRIDLPIEWTPVPGAVTLDPGETETFEFDYRVPLEEYDQAEGTISLSDLYLVSELDTTVDGFSIEEPDGILPWEVFSGGVPEGETVTTSYTPSADTELLSCALTYDDHYLDLHFYDSDGNHTGLNYETNTVETEIPGSDYSGRDTGDDNLEWIAIDDVDQEEFTVEVVAPTVTTLGADGIPSRKSVSTVDSTSIEIDGEAVSNEVSDLPAGLAFTPANVTRGVASGETLTTTLTIEETNGFNGTEADLSASGLDHYDDSIGAGNVSLGASSVGVDAGDTATVELTIDVPDGAQPGKYEGVVTADAGETSTEMAVSIIVDPEEVPPPLVGSDLPRDLDGDGLFRDIDADGEFDIFDVQAFFNNFDRPVVQNNAEFFDFDDTGDEEITIFDVQALFNQLD